jgi:membrane protease YdiL (CAAX protease family)
MSEPLPSPAADPPAPWAEDLPPWPIWTAPAAVALGFAFGGLATIVVDVVAHAGGSSLTHPPPAVNIIGDVVFDLAFIVAALYLASLRGRPSPAMFGYRPVSWRLAVKAFVLATVGYYGLTAIYGALFQLHGTDKLPSELGAEHSTPALVAASVFVCVIAPIAEEFFFRGFLFGVLRRMRINVAGRDIGTWLAAIITGVLFGLAHTGSAAIQYLPVLAFLGFVLCIVRWRTGSLYPCMALHSANNALALGVNQLQWNAAEIIGLVLASWLVIGAITGPLAAREPRLA